MEYTELKISTAEAEQILHHSFGINGKAKPLPGEIDFNFRIEVPDGDGYILKVSRANEDLEYLEYQQLLLQYVEQKGNDLISPKVVKDTEGNTIATYKDQNGNGRNVRLLTWIPGRIWSQVNPQLDALRASLGEQCGLLTKALEGFDHPMAHRRFDWDVAQALWTKEHLNLFEDEEREILSYFIQEFERGHKAYTQLRKSVVHNDANDNNIVVTEDLVQPSVRAFIDYGDAVHTQIINDVAIASAYAIMHHNDPLAASTPIVKGYHSAYPLLESELEHLYVAIAMRLVISVTKSALNKIKEPDNEYLLISEKPAWEVLKKWYEVNKDFAHYSFRQACGCSVHPDEDRFTAWAKTNSFKLEGLFPEHTNKGIHLLDLSVSSSWVGHQKEFNDLDLFQFKIEQLQKKHPNKVLAGGYLEPRALYGTASYGKLGNQGPESRTVHLGVDFWLPAGTAVHALFDGEVVTAVNDSGDKEYGGLVILKHQQDGWAFYSLYGHLTVDSATKHQIGDLIKAGEGIGMLGNYPENGNWAPHLHFQLMLSLLDYKDDFPGVAYPNQIEVWKGLCPNPNLLFNIKELKAHAALSNHTLISYRKAHLGKSLSLQYQNPVHMVRGAGQYLIDQTGRNYLDTVNNVAHVGHENYEVVKAGQDQMALLNTNSRYLHKNINELAELLLETLPKELSVLHFVNSGSEANELAIRMAKAVTGQRDIIASEIGYHGNSNMCVDISSYKFDGKGGAGAPEYTHIFPLPDAFRGKYRGADTGHKYAKEVQLKIEEIHAKQRGVCALIVESIISCGGQIELPEGFLAKAYEYVREAGGVCIADEVQVGCGRVGKAFWGFQLNNVVPDIVTIGKPLGNGHPLAAVACTQKVAEKFANGMEYFNTFGGNPVSCAIGTAVIQQVTHGKLQENALKVGNHLKEQLQNLSQKFPIIGDVRGQGLFLGFELVDPEMHPMANQADYLVNRMKDHGILMSTDGPDHNVIKIKPPLVFTMKNADELVYYLQRIFQEDFMQPHRI
nr:aminotransferase class III-fold pyridoxal phosphate-dependent enzyme [Allomuricauda sp.]